MEGLDEILRALRLSGAVFLDAEFTAPWSIAAQVGPEDCAPLMPVPARLIGYHLVTEGRLWVALAGEPATTAAALHLLVFPRNDPHVLASAPELRPVRADELIAPAGPGGLARIRAGGGGAVTRLLCGFLGTDDAGDPLLASLPPLLRLDLEGGAAEGWIEGAMRYAGRQLDRDGPAAAAGVARLAEWLFTEAVRRYVQALPPDARGWLAGLRDPVVARTLALLHGRMAEPWTLEALAAEVGISRSALADRFTRRLGRSPMRYLAEHRLRRAADRLVAGRGAVAQIAFEVGYRSEAAFSRSFKRAFGRAPATFRDEAQHR